MKLKFRSKLLFLLLLFEFFTSYCFSLYAAQNSELPTIIEAKKVTANRSKEIIKAIGNVEIVKGENKLFADQVNYNKKKKEINATGNIKLNNYKFGMIKSDSAVINDEFNIGNFDDAQLIFFDGSFLSSRNVKYNRNDDTVFNNVKFSFCPNVNISKSQKIDDNDRFAVLESEEVKIDNDKEIIKTKHAILKIYDVPVIYIPYIVNSLPSKEKKSGFLFPSYAKSSKFGFGIITPYYFNISENKDLLLTPKFSFDLNNIILSGRYRHDTSRGKYNVNINIANNKIISQNNDLTVKDRNEEYYRWNIASTGQFSLSHNSSSDYKFNILSDKNFLRDYQDDYLSHSTSFFNYNYIKNRDYIFLNFTRFQELENFNQNKLNIFVPSATYNKEFSPIFNIAKISINSNISSFSHENYLQYNRLSLKPQIEIPLIIKGSMIRAIIYNQSNFYKHNIKKNNLYNYNKNNNYDNANATSASLNWSIPMVKKNRNNSYIIEPLINFKSSRVNNSKIDIDNNHMELGFSNIFSDNYYSGYDLYENGNRLSYGISSSIKNNINSIELTVGQALIDKKKNSKINGLNDDNRSNYVGRLQYNLKDLLNIQYFFQIDSDKHNSNLDEVNFKTRYRNIELYGNYLKMSDKINNSFQGAKKQISLNSKIKLMSRVDISTGFIKDLNSKRIISRQISLYRNGCCSNFGFYLKENNPENFIKSEKTFGINFTFKNL